MVQFLDEFVFLRIVKKYDGDKYVKHFSCWNQLLTLMFGQLTGKPSLRRFIIASAPIQSKFYALGLGRNVTRSNLSKANNTRDYRIFEEFAYHIKEVGPFFVVRAKSRLRYQHVRWKRRMPKNVLSDSIIRLTVYKSKHDYPAVLRKIEFYDEEQDRDEHL